MNLQQRSDGRNTVQNLMAVPRKNLVECNVFHFTAYVGACEKLPGLVEALLSGGPRIFLLQPVRQ